MQRKADEVKETERDARSKMENNLKYAHDQTHYNLNDITSKMQYLEEYIKREEKARMEMRDKQRLTEE